MITYELAKELKWAGFPQIKERMIYAFDPNVENVAYPTLSELIEALGDRISIRLQSYWNKNDLEWQADTCGNFAEYDHNTHIAGDGSSPEIAVAKLYLALNKK